MIHYHGTPISPYSVLDTIAGRHFCISYAHKRNVGWFLENAQSIMWDNGAFSAYSTGKPFDKEGFIKWVDPLVYAPHWAVIPDVIGGSVREQRNYMKGWPFPLHLSGAVWHMDLPLDWLHELVDNYPRVCFGSSGKYWKVGSDVWKNRADEAWDLISKANNRNWIHMMRGLKMAGKQWPFASADSTNVARHHRTKTKNLNKRRTAAQMCFEIDAKQSPLIWKK